jgi:hypothetical protein
MHELMILIWHRKMNDAHQTARVSFCYPSKLRVTCDAVRKYLNMRLTPCLRGNGLSETSMPHTTSSLARP